MNFKPLLLAALLAGPLALAQTPSAAQPAPDAKRPHGSHRHHQPLMGADANKDGAVTREEAQAHFNKRFDVLDQDKDGKITRDEMRTARASMRKDLAQRAHTRFVGHFKKADANQDGMVSRAEAETSMPRLGRHFDRLDGNQDGMINMDEIRNAVFRHRGAAHRRHAPRG